MTQWTPPGSGYTPGPAPSANSGLQQAPPPLGQPGQPVQAQFAQPPVGQPQSDQAQFDQPQFVQAQFGQTRYTPMRPRRPGAVRGLVWVAIVVVLAISALLTMLVIGLSTGPVGSLVGMLLAILPVVPVAASLLWLDRFESEPPALLFFAFAWGASAAIIISLIFSITSMVVIAGAGGSDVLGAVLVAPVVEESAKSLAVLAVLLIRRGQFNGVVDGIVYAGLSGLGFAFAENILYLGGAFLDGGLEGAFVLFLLRCVMGPFAHPMFTAAFGIGLGLAVRARQPWQRFVYPVLGLLAAMSLHALWNGSTFVFDGSGWFLGYFLIQVPIFAAFVAFALTTRRREAVLIRQNLEVYARSGWITGEEFAMLASPSGRRKARAWASRVAGTPGRRAMRDFQELASETAFLRERMASGNAPANASTTEADLLRTMWQLRLEFHPGTAVG